MMINDDFYGAITCQLIQGRRTLKIKDSLFSTALSRHCAIV